MGGGSGSGVIVSEKGLVLTAAHVSAGVGKKMTVIMEDGTRYKAISLGLVASTDAAMVQIEEEGSYPYVELDRGGTPSLGDWVYALGHSGGFEKERGVGVRIVNRGVSDSVGARRGAAPPLRGARIER